MADLPSKLRALAEEVRAEAERWAAEKGEDTSLWLWCATTTLAFVALAAETSVGAVAASGFFVADGYEPDPHVWAFAWEDERCYLVDLTLTQYVPDAPKAAVFDCEAKEVRWYVMVESGPSLADELCAADRADAAVLTRRVRSHRLLAQQEHVAACVPPIT